MIRVQLDFGMVEAIEYFEKNKENRRFEHCSKRITPDTTSQFSRVYLSRPQTI